MTSEDHLDDLLNQHGIGLLKKTGKCLDILREAYTIGVPILIVKSMTDRLATSSGVAFHLGTPDPEMRRIASWLFTVSKNDYPLLLKLAKAAWKRHGREDMRLAGLILANINPGYLKEGVWSILAEMLQKTEPLEALLESIEELARAGHQIPSDDELEKFCYGPEILHHFAFLILVVCCRREGRELSETQKKIVEDRPSSTETMDRLAAMILDEASQ
ncbi:MAG: hypothetical protein ACKVHH_05860 [Candidatus Poseidoniales archaeon]|jgi:hypothetical protein|tara:strand:- start:178 stop:828 length:651 start_codon:yes stop_codon:yes gene_type:complete